MIGIIAGIILAALVCYIIYLFASYHRIEDNLALTVEKPAEKETSGGQEKDEAMDLLTVGKEYTAVTYNIGFGAYRPDFSFFMDGGKSSWARSKESVIEAVKGAGEEMLSLSPDFALVQEIDLNSTRSYHVDECAFPRRILYPIIQCLHRIMTLLSCSILLPSLMGEADRESVFSPGIRSQRRLGGAFLFPHPSANSLTWTNATSISRVPVENGKELVIFALHMSAYGNSDEIRKGQIDMLCADMQKEYEAGNYVLCGGDFNHDLKASEEETENRASWAYPFPRTELPKHFSFALDFCTEEEIEGMWDSARNADMEYVPGVTYTVTLDGFILSDNIECLSYEHVNTGYAWSDHDPVKVSFVLK